jgi:hypothetical protein
VVVRQYQQQLYRPDAGIGNAKNLRRSLLHAPTATAMVLKMTLPQIYTDPYMQAMGDQCLRELQWRPARAVQYGGVYRRDLVYREYRPKGERGRISPACS